MENYYKYFKDHIYNKPSRNLFFEYFRSFIFTIIIPITAILFLAYFMYCQNAKLAIQKNIDENKISYSNIVENAFHTAEQFNNLLSSNSDFVFISNMKKIDFNDYNTYNKMISMQQLISTYMTSSLYMDSIHIYFKNSEYVLSTNDSGDFHNFYKKNIIDNIIESNTKLLYSDCTYDTNKKMFNIYYANYSKNELNSIILLTIDIDKSKNYNMMFSLEKDGNNILASNIDNGYEKKAKNYDNIGLSDLFFGIPENFLVTNILLDYNIKLSTLHSLESYNYTGNMVLTILISCILFSLVLTFSISLYLTKKVYKNIMEISNAFPPSLNDSGITYSSELDMIIHNILSLLDKLNFSEKTIAKQYLNLKKSQSVIMQNQINPHFIYNTLNSVNLYIENHFDYDSEVSKMLANLSSMMHYIMDVKNIMTSINKEIEYTKKYIEIEAIKHLYNFDVVWNVSPDVQNQMVIKMILQPLIENALQHGIYPLNKKHGKIKINIFVKNSKLYISVSDNGIGIQKEQLKMINEKLNKNKKPLTKHIGLQNINYRLKLIYGNKATIKLYSQENVNTTALITIEI